MNFLPIKNITFKTSLSQEEVVSRLRENTEPEKNLRFGFFSKKKTKRYEGIIAEKYFLIKRIIEYGNSFLPIIKGTIQKDIHGTKVKIKMRLKTFVSVFMGIWCVGVGIGFISILISSINKNGFEPVIFLPLGMFLFAYLLTLGGFKAESAKSIKDLEEILNGRRIK